jgi:mRNA degradation ribonuclease J1/J2
MFEDFHVADRWTGEDLHCRWKANIVAIATRHADAVDVRFDVNSRPMWIALPCQAWVEQKRRTGKVITDRLTAQIAGHYLKAIVEEGYDAAREIYTMSVDEVLDHLDAVLKVANETHSIPVLPILSGDVQETSFVPTPSRQD